MARDEIYWRTVVACGVVCLGCLLLAIATTATRAQGLRGRSPAIKPRPFKLTDGGSYMVIEQPGYRTIWAKDASITAMEVYEPGQGRALDLKHPAVWVISGQREFRFDCTDSEAMETFVNFVTKTWGR